MLAGGVSREDQEILDMKKTHADDKDEVESGFSSDVDAEIDAQE